MSDVDLSALKMEERPAARPPRATRWGAIGIAALAVAVAASFLVAPAEEVRTAPVRAAGGAEAVRSLAAEAAGWVEPDPFPTTVRPLVSGVLAELPLLEGHAVKAGDTVVGRLESADLLARRDRARAEVARREAELEAARTDLDVARSLLDQKADLRLKEVAARHELASVRARLGALRGSLHAAEAVLDARRAELEAQERLAEEGASYPVALARARAAVREAEADVDRSRREIEALEAEEARDEETLAIARELIDDPRGLEGAVANAEATLARAEAELSAARVELDVAERELSWATVKAPADGLVLELLAAPGERVGPEGHGIVSIYDPARLQARIDVPLGSVGAVHVGQEVEVVSEVLPGDKTRGVVARIQHVSDMLKNTLQVKVRLIDPDPLLRPDTLVRARFLAPAQEEAAAVEMLFRVPREAVRGGAVFLFDPRGRARRVAVEVEREEGGDAVVRGPLSPTQRVILDPVEDGTRVKEDS